LPLRFSHRESLPAEVLFLRRQLALYVERGVKPTRIDAATRVSLALLVFSACSACSTWRLLLLRSRRIPRSSSGNA
jgi:hypothetical protein